nr:uncharacterized protein LOC111425503 [Onthophagus taurus]
MDEIPDLQEDQGHYPEIICFRPQTDLFKITPNDNLIEIVRKTRGALMHLIQEGPRPSMITFECLYTTLADCLNIPLTSHDVMLILIFLRMKYRQLHFDIREDAEEGHIIFLERIPVESNN